MNLEAVRLRDKHVCWLCGEHVPVGEATIDHLLPRSHGGWRKGSNEKLAHSGCNNTRGNLPYDQTVAAIASVGSPEDFKSRGLQYFARKAAIKKALKDALGVWQREQNIANAQALHPRMPKPIPDKERAQHEAWCNFRWFAGFPPNDVAPLCTC